MSRRKGSQLKAKIAGGEAVFGTFIGLNDPIMVRIFAQIGFDFLLIDTEHNAFNPESLQQVLLMFEGTDTCPIVRVPWHEQAWTKWALDFGAEGILFPNVRTAEDARQVVANCKYPPQGIRGFFPRAASNFLLDLDEYMTEIDERILVWTQIEHTSALDNLENILAVPGIDAIFIGPADLSISMGILSRYDNPDYLQAINKVFNSARKAGIPVAYHMYDDSPEFVKQIAGGVQIFSYGFDWIFAQQSAVNYLVKIKDILAGLRNTST
jgi:2-keto-3-deoxy-L-rhamnonate aldolase RhmA